MLTTNFFEDLKVQYLLYVESLLTHKPSSQTHISLIACDVDAGWHIVTTIICKDPLSDEIDSTLLQAVSSFFTAHKEWFTARNLEHVKDRRLHNCLDNVFRCHVTLHHFYDLLRQSTAERKGCTLDLKLSIEDFVRGLIKANEILNIQHNLLNMPNWLQLVSMCGL